MTGAPFSVVCTSVTGSLFRVQADEFMKKVNKEGRNNDKKLVDNLMTKFKAIESKTQSL
jgi:hypothetical protein